MSDQSISRFSALKRHLTNLFLAGFLGLVLIDALPTTSLFHDRLKAGVDPFLDRVGLWQESWKLFAPEVDRMNVRMSAEITFDDGTERVWRSPDWPEMSPLEKFLRFREMEFIDAVRNDSARGAWAGFAHYLIAKEAIGIEATPTSVVLKRHWVEVPSPDAQDRQRRLPSQPMGTYVIYQHELNAN